MRTLVILLAVLSFVLPPMARGAVIAGGTGTENFADPGNGLPWAHVASNGVYLGNYGGNFWAITATHVGAGNLTLGGSTYNFVPGSSVQVLNEDNSGTDLLLFRIASDPGLGTLTLATASPGTGAVVTFVGDGGIEANSGERLYWDVNGTTWTQLPNSSGAERSGYAVAGGAGKRWGDAVVAGATSFNIGTGETTAFATQFLDQSGSSQGASGDSGGAAFFLSGGTWYLSGILGAIGTYEGQPGSTAVFGNLTYAGDIADYRSFIITAIPEPAETSALVGITCVLALIIVRVRRGR